ncbi:MAG: SurA N-terminal domain-containing protein [Candidatus Binatia bacterium]
MRRSRFAALAGLALLHLSCGRWQPLAQKSADDFTSPSGAVARVNGIPLAREPYDRALGDMLARYEKTGREIAPGARERFKNSLVKGMVEDELTRQHAAELGVTVSREDEDQEWRLHGARYRGGHANDAALSDELRTQIHRYLLQRKVYAKVAESVAVSVQEIQEAFDRNPGRLVDPKHGRPRSFDDVKHQIEAELRLLKRNEAVHKWRSAAKIEIFERGDESIIAAERQANAPPAAR